MAKRRRRQARQALDLQSLARIGAALRLDTLRKEIASIIRTFPDIEGVPPAVPRTTRIRKRRKMSAEARRKISEAQKKRWAKERGR